MSRVPVRLFLLLMAVLASVPAAATEEEMLTEARGVASSVPPRLLATLQAEIGKGGFEGAIAACRDFAPRLAAAASGESGWAIRRVSLRHRNPKAVPDDWERVHLEDFDRRAAAGESPASLEKGETVASDGVREYRYIKALPTQQLCLACHGGADDISPAVRARLETLYPDDRATGYRAGDIRGAITLRKPL